MTRLSDRRKARRVHDAGHRTMAWLAAVALLLTHMSASAAGAVSLDQAFATPSLTGVVPSSPAWSPDSQRFAFTWNDEGLPRRQLWIANRDGSGLERVESEATAELSVRDIAWLSDGRTILSLRGSGLWSTDVDEGVDTLIADIGTGASRLSVAPTGGTAAWLKGGDVWLLDLDDPMPVQATDVGIAGLSSLPAGRYSRPEREIGPGIWGGPTYAWSPDGETIAVHYVDRREMREVPFPDYLAKETSPNYIRRGYPGDPNELRTVGLLDVASRELTLLDLDDPTANQVVGFSWSSSGVLLLDLAADTNVDRWLYTYRPGDEQPARIWHSHRESRIYTAFASAWHPDGETVIFLSDIEDRYGLYAIDSTGGGTPERLTDPGFDVLSAPIVNAASNTVFFAGNRLSPYVQDIYRVGLEGGENLRVTNEGGRSTGVPSPDGEFVAIITSSDARPPELYVVSSDGALSQKVTASPRPEYYFEYDWVHARYVTIPSEIDDYVLHLRILEPKNLDRSRRYPVVFGPAYSNTVRDRWRGVYTLVQQMLVQRGYIVVQVDMRGSTGYGREFREEFLLDFTGEDLEDVVSAANYIKTLPYVDPDRLGIWGSSYGGTLSVYTLLKKPGLFHAGVAAASAVDPYFFGTDDVAIVRRPQSDPEIFQRTARQYAANLEDELLLIHGMQDQVVPFKTIADLAEALIREGKNFDTAFVPGATHAWSREPGYDRYLFGKLFEFFDRHLEPDRIVPAESSGAAQ